MRHLPLLLALSRLVSLRQIKVALWGAGLLYLGLLTLVGDLVWGWRGALGGLIAAIVLFHLVIRITLWLGMKAYDKGQLARAAGLLWLAEIPALRIYDRTGRRATASRKSREMLTAQFMQNLIGTRTLQ
jgi:hypothetical protein